MWVGTMLVVHACNGAGAGGTDACDFHVCTLYVLSNLSDYRGGSLPETKGEGMRDGIDPVEPIPNQTCKSVASWFGMCVAYIWLV